MKYLILFFLFLPLLSISQATFSLELKIGQYENDPNEKKFYVNERVWKIENQKLSYQITENEKFYSDTIPLNQEDLDSIQNYMLKKQLNENYQKIEKSKFIDKMGRSSMMKLTSQQETKEIVILLKAEGAYSLERTPKGANLKGLENLFYKLTEKEKKEEE